MIHYILTLVTELLAVSIVVTVYHIQYMVDHCMHVWSDILFGIYIPHNATKTGKELHPLLALNNTGFGYIYRLYAEFEVTTEVRSPWKLK